MRKGFTLVELLGVIIIISLLALLTSVAVTKLVKDSKEEISNVQKELIKSSAEMWGADNLDRLPDVDECAYLSVLDLKNEGLLNDDDLDDDIKVKMTNNKVAGNQVIKYEVNPTDTTGCDYALAYRDGSFANKPKMLEGLVPVMYDESKKSWVIADITKEWYDYDNQWWANAVILKSELRNIKKVGDVVTVPTENNDFNSSDVLAMFVWIPRYEYTIKGAYGRKLSESDAEPTQALPGAIDIKFVRKSVSEDGLATYNGNKPKEWYTHPAFTFGDDELSGIWVGKFETSHTTYSSTTTSNQLNCTNEICTEADNIRILPNVQSLRYQTVAPYFYVVRSMSRDGNPFGINSNITDTHMMKNSEWGAVVYLSQSKYGKYGNSDYTSGNKEVYKNDSSSYYTGRSSGKPGTDGYSSEGTCKYDDITNREEGKGSCGPGASITGNIYGVYDMSGGAYEYVMGYLITAKDETNLPWGSNSSENKAGFKDQPNEKYFDGYTNTTIETACNYAVCKGHALSETSRWYTDYIRFVSADYPWFVRGSGYDSNTSGVFSFTYYTGGAYHYGSFRVVLAPTI